MDDQKRGNDAGDHAPKPERDTDKDTSSNTGRQDAPNYDDRTDGGRAIKREDVNSANDE